MVTGYVDDIRPYLDGACVAVAPMQVAVGVQNKILEAMAMGLPVVATPLATRALGARCRGWRRRPRFRIPFERSRASHRRRGWQPKWAPGAERT